MSVEIKIPRFERNEAVQTSLTTEQRANLLQMVQGGGYPVLLQIMRAACILQDGRMIAVEPDNEKGIIAEQHIAVAMWGFFDWMQKQVAKEINDHVNGADKDLRTIEEIEVGRVLNP